MKLIDKYELVTQYEALTEAFNRIEEWVVENQEEVREINPSLLTEWGNYILPHLKNRVYRDEGNPYDKSLQEFVEEIE